MKKMWFVLGLAMLSFVSQSSAATFNKGLIRDSVGFENTITNSVNADRPFSDTWNFAMPVSVNSVAISITNIAIKLGGFAIGAINTLQAKLNGTDLELDKGGSGFVLLNVLSGASSVSQTSHVLQVTGIVPKGNLSSSYGGNITATKQDLVEPELPDIPIPSIVWLFGSALLGLLGIICRKQIINT
jgi:hypothetical protein